MARDFGVLTYLPQSRPPLACHRWGDPAGVPLLLLHGVQGCGRVWEPTATRLAEHGFHVVALDLRGHGRSAQAGRYDLAHHVQDALGVLTGLGLAPAHVVGHSLGATIAWTLAARHPHAVRRLVIEDQHPERDDAAADTFRSWAKEWQWRFTSRHAALTFLEARGSSYDWWEPSLEQTADGEWTWSFDEDSVVESVRGIASIDHWATLREVVAPTLVVRGRDSSHLSPATAAAMIEILPRGRLLTLPGDHWVHREPDIYARAIEAHLITDYLDH